MAALSLVGQKFDGLKLAQHLCAELPAYAVPLFLRLREVQEVTGTFKYRKVELKREGFDPSSVDEPLFVLADRERGYEALNAALFERIKNGAVRL